MNNHPNHTTTKRKFQSIFTKIRQSRSFAEFFMGGNPNRTISSLFFGLGNRNGISYYCLNAIKKPWIYKAIALLNRKRISLDKNERKSRFDFVTPCIQKMKSLTDTFAVYEKGAMIILLKIIITPITIFNSSSLPGRFVALDLYASNFPVCHIVSSLLPGQLKLWHSRLSSRLSKVQ